MDVQKCTCSCGIPNGNFRPRGMHTKYSNLLACFFYAADIGHFFLINHEDARLHSVQLVQNMLETETIHRMEWPSCFPVLNSIRHFSDTDGRCLAVRTMPLLAVWKASRLKYENFPNSYRKPPRIPQKAAVQQSQLFR